MRSERFDDLRNPISPANTAGRKASTYLAESRVILTVRPDFIFEITRPVASAIEAGRNPLNVQQCD